MLDSHGNLRDELLNGEIFTTLLEAKVLIEQWKKEYN
jgi:putative transposase